MTVVARSRDAHAGGACYPPGGHFGDWIHDRRLHGPPVPGTIWRCDDCGRLWVAEHRLWSAYRLMTTAEVSRWRRSRRREAKRRARRLRQLRGANA